MSVRRTDDFVVGLVVIVATVIIVAAALWAQRADFGQRRSPVEARFRDVGNAQVGGAVVVRGVNSGRIEGIELADDGWVEMRLRMDDGVKLPPDPVVVLGQASLFGEWQATITERSALPPNPELRRQVEEASGNGDMLPGASLPDVAQLTAVAGRIAGDVASLSKPTPRRCVAIWRSSMFRARTPPYRGSTSCHRHRSSSTSMAGRVSAPIGVCPRRSRRPRRARRTLSRSSGRPWRRRPR